MPTSYSRRIDPAATRLPAAFAAQVVAVQPSDAEGQVQGLTAVQPGVARRFVAVAQVALGDGLAAADAFGDIVAGELDMDASGVSAMCPVNLEEASDLVQHIVEM